MESEAVHSFIVRIWLEETFEDAGTAIWRGLITYVPSGHRRYIDHLDEIPAFITPYLEALGVTVQRRGRVMRSVRRLTHFLRRS